MRILNAATMEELAILNLLADPATTPNPKLLITNAYAGALTGNTLVNYYVEIDKGLVNDVPVVAGDATNSFDGLFRTSLMVTSKDDVAPVLSSTTPTLPAINVNTNFSIKLTFSEPVMKVSTIPVDAFVVEKVLAGPVYEAYEVVDPANVVTNGTADVMINLGRALVSSTQYRLSVKLNAFEDLAGNDHAAVTLSGNITAKDVLAPTVTYSPVKGATGVLDAVVPMTLTFSEAIRNLDNSAIDSYDLDSLVYFRKGTTPMPFTVALVGNVITITPAAALVKDAFYTYGFKAKFEDVSDNVTAADAATFSTVTTSPAALFLSWTPAKAVAPATSTWLGATSPVTLNFSGPIFTYDAVVPANSNLPVTAAYAAASITVTKNTVLIPSADLVFTVDNVANTISVAPKVGTDWGSQSAIVVTLLPAKIQVLEGNVNPITDVSTYNAEDIIDPIVDATKTDAVFTAGYHPANVGVLGASPVIGKSDQLKLYFTENVKVGTGTVEIYRWDGVLAKPAMMATVDATDKKLVSLGDLSDLPTNQEYYAIVNPGAVVDVTDNNPYAGITTVKTFKFNLMDDAIPQVVSYLPVTSNIAVSTKLTVSFDRPVVLGTSGAGYVALYKSAAGGDAVQLWRVADNGTTAAFTISGSTATVNISTLEANTRYYVEVSAGSFASAADNTKEQVAISRSVWTFSTEVNAAPVVTTYSPANTVPMAEDVPLNSALVLTFDQDVVAGTGNIQLHRKQTFGGPIITNFDVADATKVTFNGNTLTIAGDVLNLQNFSEYYVIIPGTAVKNTSLTPDYYAGITVPLAYQFKTFNDVTGPTAVVAPKGNSGLFPADVKLTMTFNEAVVAGAGKVTLYNAADDAVVEEYTFAPAMLTGKVLTIVPTVELLQQTTYYVQVDAGLVKDVWTNSYLGIADKTTWAFTTGDFTGPTVVVTPPVSPVATVFTVGLKFNEVVTGVLGGVTVTGGTLTDVEGTTDTYTLTISALQQTEVTIVLTDAIKDISPNTNKFAGLTLTYTTGDFTAPELVTWTPFDETTTDNHPTFKMTFSEDVVLGDGALKVYKVNTVTPVLTIPLTAAMINGKDVTVTYAATQSGLDKDARYYVLVDGTALKDKAGNAFIGVSDVAAWTFKTGPDFATVIRDPKDGSLEFKVYPNPFVDYVNVANVSELSKIVVTNIAGQMVKEIVNPTERIQLNELRSGIYFMSLYNSDDVIVKTAKIVKR